MSLHKLTFLSFLVGFVFVGAACTSSKPVDSGTATAPTTVVTASPISQKMSNPDESQASEDAPLSSDNDVDSLQKDLDNTDISSLNTTSTQVQSELNQ